MLTPSLLGKTRSINKILQKGEDGYVDFQEIANVFKDVIHANVYIVQEDGTILGYALVDEFECEIMVKQVLKEEHFPERYNQFLLRDDELRYNLQQKSNRCVFLDGTECIFAGKIVTVIPVLGGGKRLGTLLLARFNEYFEEKDLILAETGATVIGMEILRSHTEESEEEARHREIVKLALNTLSFSELEAIEQIFKELNASKGMMVASKIADDMDITRSVIVNAIRKLESAGIVESSSLGMKGTFIKALNPYLFEYLGRKVRTF